MIDISIELGKKEHIDEMEQFYYVVTDYLEGGNNYPGWRKGIYPARQDAVDGIENSNLFLAKCNGQIAGSIILNHVPAPAYANAEWSIQADYSDIYVIHTFAVHPDFHKVGVGRSLLDFSVEHAIQSKVKAIRLDVYQKNIPAIKLYQKCGFSYIDTVDLGLGEYGLQWFDLYEKIIHTKPRF